MIDSLTNLLERDETLMHPIYGILNQGNRQFYGFFGFTESHLLIALVVGKTITYTTRIPLDIKSVKIKQTKIFRQYVIDIAFNEGAPCRITAAPKVFTIDVQKDHLPQFLNYLKSKTPQNEVPELKNIDGDKIRWQYFNTYIYIMLSIIPMAPIMIILAEFKKSNFDVFDILSEMLEAIPVVLGIYTIFIGPTIVLSLLNRFFFGKIIGVARDEGLYLENNLIRWSDIQKITYTPQILAKNEFEHTFATIFVKPSSKEEYALDIMHFPLYGLKKLKKYNPDIKIELSKSGLYVILLVALLPTLTSIITFLFV